MTTSPLWTPSRERCRAANLSSFRSFVEEQGHRPGPGYEALWRWSVEKQAAFWDTFWDWSGVVGEKGARILETGAEPMRARYFPDGRLNFAENLLQRRDAAPAIIARTEDGSERRFSWQELYGLVSRLAGAMQAEGVGPGDRVALLLPNIPEAVAAALAAASLGAVITAASPDFGVNGVVDRFGQVGPVLLFGINGYRHAGTAYPVVDKLAQVAARLPSLRRTIVIARGGNSSSPSLQGRTNRLLGGVSFVDFIGPHKPRELSFRRLPFAHPLYILFSSGTTGPPKCIIHGAGGVLLQHLKEQRLHADVKPGDRVFYYTTLGWMMWNWLVSILGSRATVLLYEGSPAYPGLRALFDFADSAGMTHLGTSARFIGTLRTSGFRPRETHALVSLRTLLSTGSPLDPEGFRYIYDHVKRDLHLASVSGGTDLCACFVGGLPTRPVYAGEIQGPALGMAVDVYDDRGRPLKRGGGELVCTRPFPSLPLGFRGDPEGKRYHDAYFRRFPGVWRHGDYIERTETGGYVIHGRSDATLNPGGVRIGTAEIYRVVEAMAEVREALAISMRAGDKSRASAGEEVVLFVRIRPGGRSTAAFESASGARSESTPAPVTFRPGSWRSPTCPAFAAARSWNLRCARSSTGKR